MMPPTEGNLCSGHCRSKSVKKNVRGQKKEMGSRSHCLRLSRGGGTINIGMVHQQSSANCKGEAKLDASGTGSAQSEKEFQSIDAGRKRGVAGTSPKKKGRERRGRISVSGTDFGQKKPD